MSKRMSKWPSLDSWLFWTIGQCRLVSYAMGRKAKKMGKRGGGGARSRVGILDRGMQSACWKSPWIIYGGKRLNR